MSTPQKTMRAHQYLYYVCAQPVISDYEYDQFCAANNLDGAGGSDSECDYTPEEIELAMSLKNKSTNL
jgi:hypothetical protein